MRSLRDEVLSAAGAAVAKAGLRYSFDDVDTDTGLYEMRIDVGDRRIGRLWLAFTRDRFDAMLWDEDGHIVAGRNNVRRDWIDERLWTMADIERALRVAAAAEGCIAAAEIPSDFILGALIADAARLPMRGEEAHRWSTCERLGDAIVREARTILGLGDYDRSRSLRFVRFLARAREALDVRTHGLGIVMMSRRSRSVVQGRILVPILEWEWEPHSAPPTPRAPRPRRASPRADDAAEVASPSVAEQAAPPFMR